MTILPKVLAKWAARIEGAKHGETEAEIQAACAETGLARATLLRKIQPYRTPKARKTRKDKGTNQLTAKELELISAAWLHTRRKNNKTMATLERLLKILRANGYIKAEFINEATGEVRPYSHTSIERALRNANLHPDQLLRPTPVTQMRSLHPNYCWQLDPSLCVLYYLKESGKGNGLCIMEEGEFYKNKPENIAKVEPQRVWRYVITDHASGAIYVEYVYGGETAENVSQCFINAIQPKAHPDEPFYGVPKKLMFDRGTANKSHLFTHVTHWLGVESIIPKQGNARAKGQVEKGNDIVERQFESGLRFLNVSGLDELNKLAHQWMRHFNGTEIHSRHKTTRYRAWSRIRPGELIEPPSREICRELMVSQLAERLVTDKLEITFENRRYDVSGVPDVQIGEKIKLGKNPYRPECVQVECREIIEEEGKQRERLYWVVLEPVETDEYGFRRDAALIGEEYKAHRRTAFEINRDKVDQLAYAVDNEDDLKRAKKANKPLFDGEIDPYKHITDSVPTMYIPKRGQEHELTTNARRVERKPVDLVKAAKEFKAKFEFWDGDYYKRMAKRYAQGVPVEEFEHLLNLSAEEFKAEWAPKGKVLKLGAAA